MTSVWWIIIEKNDHEGLYIFYHPKEAIENQKKWNLSKGRGECYPITYVSIGGEFQAELIVIMVADKNCGSI